MAKQKGIIKIKGSLGGITFYQRNGQDLSRVTNGPTKDKIRNDPNFIRTRENMQEFAGAAFIGKAFRNGLVMDFKEMSDLTGTARITRLMKQIISKGTGKRGERNFSPVLNSNLFLTFSFSEHITFESVFLAPFSSSVNAGRDSVTITMPDFNTSNLVHSPSGATHFRIINLISILSEYKFNPTSMKYEPTDPESNMKYDFNASPYIALGGNIGSTTTIITAITPAPPIETTSVLISCIGIEFYQKVGADYYLLASNNAMKIANVY